MGHFRWENNHGLQNSYVHFRHFIQEYYQGRSFVLAARFLFKPTSNSTNHKKQTEVHKKLKNKGPVSTFPSSHGSKSKTNNFPPPKSDSNTIIIHSPSSIHSPILHIRSHLPKGSGFRQGPVSDRGHLFPNPTPTAPDSAIRQNPISGQRSYGAFQHHPTRNRCRFVVSEDWGYWDCDRGFGADL